MGAQSGFQVSAGSSKSTQTTHWWKTMTWSTQDTTAASFSIQSCVVALCRRMKQFGKGTTMQQALKLPTPSSKQSLSLSLFLSVPVAATDCPENLFSDGLCSAVGESCADTYVKMGPGVYGKCAMTGLHCVTTEFCKPPAPCNPVDVTMGAQSGFQVSAGSSKSTQTTHWWKTMTWSTQPVTTSISFKLLDPDNIGDRFGLMYLEDNPVFQVSSGYNFAQLQWMMYNGKDRFQFYDDAAGAENKLKLPKTGVYEKGDLIEIKRKNNVISFLIKGKVVYTSDKEVDPSKTLIFAHTPSLAGAGLFDMKIC
eukprot:CAMPEP_0197703108 /NCGR_PEP_ID=MMETSP1338-20131121/125272_1 /TAXON_ID=43686 ORGANISM="Pelagodinium beii, Strain RCC1491" /NCGR_SAMPLE_ID=MMETSP1338 /ASSEMBLY_ACC=CAM_ASM_000754 /LENGTH=308 /DNA_ID=CAMNT_0043287001 /DNA_START=379 /DNA_END=1306 /DNA_ORIENTATION=-